MPLESLDSLDSLESLMTQAATVATATLPAAIGAAATVAVLSQGARPKGASANADLVVIQNDTGARPVFLMLDPFGSVVDPTGLVAIFAMRSANSSTDAALGSSALPSPKIIILGHYSVPDTDVLGNARTYLNCPQLHFAAADVANAGTFNAKLSYVDVNGDNLSAEFVVQILADKS